MVTFPNLHSVHFVCGYISVTLRVLRTCQFKIPSSWWCW